MLLFNKPVPSKGSGMMYCAWGGGGCTAGFMSPAFWSRECLQGSTGRRSPLLGTCVSLSLLNRKLRKEAKRGFFPRKDYVRFCSQVE